MVPTNIYILDFFQESLVKSSCQSKDYEHPERIFKLAVCFFRILKLLCYFGTYCMYYLWYVYLLGMNFLTNFLMNFFDEFFDKFFLTKFFEKFYDKFLYGILRKIFNVFFLSMFSMNLNNSTFF